MTQAAFQLLIYLRMTLNDYLAYISKQCAPLCLDYVVLGTEPRSPRLQSALATDLHPSLTVICSVVLPVASQLHGGAISVLHRTFY
jgi:hypothetical protein